ncbi:MULTISPECIES: hypothetical protein [Stenotrophomonas maltophilia group]|nr:MULTISPECIES: hypothetical protein [Stenotrophomonas maltophilia group]MDT3557726.1 hypothetical protein [Stenotrophomonas maltophilia group sp. msm1]
MSLPSDPGMGPVVGCPLTPMIAFSVASGPSVPPNLTDGEGNMEKRVCFDFEIDFSNGGGIQGQGFRLDIAGDDITDKALADYIVRDMRLLMVGEVRILNKEIIEEPHKRPAHGQDGSTVHDPKDG